MKNEMPNHYTKNGIEYRRVGDYYFPVLLEPAEQPDIGKWGLMRKDYLDRNQPELISHLLLSGQLSDYLFTLNEQAQDQFESIVSAMKATEGVTEQLKAAAQLEWIHRMQSTKPFFILRSSFPSLGYSSIS